MQATSFIRGKTKYIKVKPKARPMLFEPETMSVLLKPFISGEAKGDYSLAVLLAVRNLLKDPQRFSFRHRAISSGNEVTETTSSTARKWNIHGAVDLMMTGYIAPVKKQEVLALISRVLPREWKGEPLFRFVESDGMTHGRVIHLLNMAVAACKADMV